MLTNQIIIYLLFSHNLWVGLSDHGKEGSFRLMNETKYDPGDKSVDALYYFDQEEPNKGKDANRVYYYREIDGFCRYTL